ncbi:MAG: hypothetical protein P4L46_25495 [Fimbriimonas sp.]|nr:hypothetical protein [Fimbriimonas sp.]
MIALLVCALAGQTGFDPSKLGIRNPNADLANSNEDRRRRSHTKGRSRTKPGQFVRRVAPKETKPWSHFSVVVGIRPEATPHGISLPAVRWEWFVESGGKAWSKAGGRVDLAKGPECVLPNITNQPGYIVWSTGDSGASRDWEVAQDTEYTELPETPWLRPGPRGVRLWNAPKTVVLKKNTIDVELLQVPPSSIVRYGKEILGSSPIATGGLRLKFPVAYNDKGAYVMIEDSRDGVKRITSVSLADSAGPANPYRPFSATISPGNWILDSVDEIAFPADELLGKPDPKSLTLASLTSSDDIEQLLGPPDSRDEDGSAKYFGWSDGSHWWKYLDKGVEFKVREVDLGDSKTRKIVETAAISTATGGEVAGLRVGDQDSQIEARLGRRDARSPYGHEDPGLRSYFGGGLAFTVDLHSHRIQRIELRRPLSFIRNGLVPTNPVGGDYARIVDIDYGTAEIVFSVPGGASLPGNTFLAIRNLDVDAFAESDTGARVLARVFRSKNGFAEANLYLGTKGRAKPIDVSTARIYLRRLLSAKTAFSYGIPVDW